MRTLLILLFLITFCFGFAYGQSRSKISLRVLKENIKIDSLIDVLLNSKADSAFNYGPLKSEWLSIEVDFNRYSIESETKMQINFTVNKMAYEKGTVGFFQYKGHKILVYTKLYFGDFFYKTSNVRSFHNIFKLKDLNSFPGHVEGSWEYKYDFGNGRFIPDPPPLM